METKMKKGRLRLKRGQLKDFSELPFYAQVTFKLIARELRLVDADLDDVFIYGSYFWGSWDEQSDYDVRINQKLDYPLGKFKEYMSQRYNMNVDVMVHGEPRIEMNLINIPV